jgi:predicted AAA+ superfamily ATPase
MNKPKQLIFPFQINQKASFDSFFCSPDNQNLMTRLADIVSSQDTSELIIHGEEGSGKSFLMQAICNELSSAEKQFAFIPMKKAFNMGVDRQDCQAGYSRYILFVRRLQGWHQDLQKQKSHRLEIVPVFLY